MSSLTCHHCTTHLFLVQSSVIITQQILREQKFADWVSPPIAASRWRAFWQADIRLEARSLWYRLLHGRLHCQVSTSHFSSLNGTRRCVWCVNIDEDLQHLFIQYPQKWHVWMQVLSEHFYGVMETPASLELTVFGLQQPRRPSEERMWQVLICTLLCI